MKIKLNDISINYHERGLPTGLPVVFIHAFPANLEMWEPQMKALPNNIRAVTFDLRGQGQTDVGDGQFTIDFFVDDLVALLDHLAIDKAVLCGLSMGGYVALRAFERFPHRVRGLGLCDTRAEADGNEAKTKRTALLKNLKADGIAAFADSFVKTVLWEKTFTNNPPLVDSLKRMIRNNSPLGVGGALLALASRTDSSHVLPMINVPTLILVGEHDTTTPPAISQAMHGKISDSLFHVIPNAAHLANMENPSAFNDQLIEFLKEFSA